MIACDYCDEWYHGACVGVPETPGISIKSYKCDACKDEKEEFKMTSAELKDRNKALKNPNQDHEEDDDSDSSSDSADE